MKWSNVNPEKVGRLAVYSLCGVGIVSALLTKSAVVALVFAGLAVVSFFGILVAVALLGAKR